MGNAQPWAPPEFQESSLWGSNKEFLEKLCPNMFDQEKPMSVDKRKEFGWCNERVSDNFSKWEFACRCCGGFLMKEEAIQLVQCVRDILGVPISLTSAYRCAKHNAEVGGAEFSQHIYGRACDMAKPTEVSWDAFIEAAVIATQQVLTIEDDEIAAEPVGGIGIYEMQDFIHIDSRPGAAARWRG